VHVNNNNEKIIYANINITACMESGLYTRTEYTLTSLRRKGKGREASGKRKIASFPHLTPVVERSQYQGLLPSSRFSRIEEERETNRSI